MTTPPALRLSKVHLTRYQMPLKRPYGTARGLTTAAVNFLVQVTAFRGDKVIEGVGECQPRHSLTGDGGKDRVAAWTFLCAAAQVLHLRSIGASNREEAVSEVRGIMRELETLAGEHADDSNRDRPFRGTLLGLEVALLDLVSRSLGLQVSELLGKRRDEIGISISTISSSTRFEDVATRVVKQRRFPMTRVKGMGVVDEDLRLLDCVTQANRSVGREKPLWIDINEALSYEGATRLVVELAARMGSGALPASLILEGILPKSEVLTLPSLQRLADEQCRAADRRGLDLRIMPDEGMWDTSDLMRLNASGGCRAINIKAPKAGGLLASLDLANAAVAADPDIHICVGGMLGTSDITAWALHNLARALPRVDYITTVPPQNVETRIAEPLAKYSGPGSNVIAPQSTTGIGTRLRMDTLGPYISATHEPGQAGGAPRREAPQVTKTLVLAGDTSLGDVYVNRRGSVLLDRLQQEPMSFFDGLRPVVSDHDALIVNLETVLADSPTSPYEGRKSYLGWDSPGRTIGCLRELGVDAVSLANNHSMDFGERHLLGTRDRLEQAGIRTFGAGASREKAAAPLTLRMDFDGVERRVYVIGAMQLQTRLRDDFDYYAGSSSPGVNALSVARIVPTIRGLRATDPTSLIIVFPHWGRNYQWASDALQRSATALRDAGADLIIGHGAHMLQQCTFSDHSATVYSLGNFLFNWNGRFEKFGAPPFGLVARVGLTPLDAGWKVDLRLYPILIDNARTGHRPAPVDEHGFKSVWSALCEMDLDQSFNRRARGDRDAFGHHIAYSFATSGPATGSAHRDGGQEVIELADIGSSDPPNTYDDEESARLHSMLDRRLLSSLLIAREAERDGAVIEWLGADTFVASVGGRELLFKGNRCNESVPANRIVRDKALLKKVLAGASVRTPRGGVATSFDQALELWTEIGGPVVVKPRSGDRGKGVTVGVETADGLRRAYDRAASPAGVLVEEFISGPEFRCMATAEYCFGVSGRDAPSVIGDSVHRIAELIEVKNQARRKNPNLRNRLLASGEQVSEFLGRSGLSLDSVPGAGTKVYVSGAGNVTGGADNMELTDLVPDAVKVVAVEAVKAVPGLRWGGVDVILRHQLPDRRVRDAYVLEINVNAGISGFHYPVFGKPRNLARQLWRARLAAEDPQPSGGSGDLRPFPEVASTVVTPLAGPDRSGMHRAGHASVDLGEPLLDYLSARGWARERLAPRLVRVARGPHEDLMYGCLSTDDLAAVSQVMSRRVVLKRLLQRADIPLPASRVARSVDDLEAFLSKSGGTALVVRLRGDTKERRLTSVGRWPDREELAEVWREVGDGGPVFVQDWRSGARLRVLATRQEAAAVFYSGTEAGERVPDPSGIVAEVSGLSTAAVRAVPELRWAAVDVLLPAGEANGERAGRAVVEAMSLYPKLKVSDRLLVGSLERFFGAVSPAS